MLFLLVYLWEARWTIIYNSSLHRCATSFPESWFLWWGQSAFSFIKCLPIPHICRWDRKTCV